MNQADGIPTHDPAPAPAPSWSAFISYASENLERAEAICSSLEARGFRCWMAPRDIRAGYEYADEIVRGIEQSRCMVVVLSEAANASPFVRREVERAVSKRKPVFPVRIEEVLPSPGLELFISATHWIDAWGSRFTEQVDRLARDLSGFSTATKPGWRVRWRHLKRRASRWAATVSVAIVAIAILMLASLAIVRRFPGNDAPGADVPSRTGTTGSAESAPERSTTTLGGGASLAAAAVPPTTGGVTDPVRESFKQRALSSASWMTCSEGFCTLTRLNTYFAGVRRINFGETRDRLERTIEIALPQEALDASRYQNIAEQFVADHIPVRPGVDSLFVRLDFYDGTQSEIRPARIERDDRRTLGVSLPVIASPPGATAPILYAGYTLGQPAVRFTPHAPEGTAAVMYSLDGGGYYPSPVTASASRARTPRGFRFEGTPAGGEVRLEIRPANGDAVGPFRYDAAPAASLILNTMKASLEADLYGLIRCTRLNFSFDQKSLERARTASDATQRREAGRITSALESEGLSSVQRGPAVACRPDWQTHAARTRNYLGDWAAVRELHFGVRSGRLGTNIRNPLEIPDALANRIPRSREFGRLWTAVLPADAEGVYVRLEFRDGSSSEEFRVPITDLALPGPP